VAPAERPTRKETQARTRQRLLDVSHELFTRDGYHAVSMARIAAEAGYTTGALYANFRSKSDLFLALIESERRRQRLATEAAIVRRLRDAGQADGAPSAIEAAVAAMGDVFERQMADHPGWQLAQVEFLSTVRADDDLRSDVSRVFQRAVDELADTVRAFAAADGVELGVDPDHLARVVIAIDAGISLIQHLDSDVPPAELYRIATDAIRLKATAPS